LKKIIVILVFLTGIFGYSQDYAKGKQLFNQHCAACHKMDRKLVGPPLQDVVELQGRDWTKEWIYNSKALIDSGDDHAVEIWEEYNRAAMPAYNFLPDEELEDIVEYLAQYKTKKAEAAAVIAPVATDGGQVIVNNTPTPIYIYVLLIICLIIVTVAIYAFYVGLKAISDITAKTQSTNLYLMKKLHMDQEKVDGELQTLVENKVKKKVDKKLKQFKKDLNKRLRDLK
jgi:cytochrome c2|tara:strand:- start:228 stop:911 length:684 start_codon:yes stop_codon:yes gene_type:complete